MTRNYAKCETKIKLDKEAHQDTRQNVKLNPYKQSTWSTKIMSFTLCYFAPEKFFRGQIGVDEQPKILDSDRIMKEFFVECKKDLGLKQMS